MASYTHLAFFKTFSRLIQSPASLRHNRLFHDRKSPHCASSPTGTVGRLLSATGANSALMIFRSLAESHPCMTCMSSSHATSLETLGRKQQILLGSSQPIPLAVCLHATNEC